MKQALAGLAVLFAAVLVAHPTTSHASNCALDEYEHNGSSMEVHWCDEGLNIAYERPRRAILKHGVRQGTILFEGSVTHSGLISGQARVFKRGCGALSYPVSGRQIGDRIVLRGRAPVRTRGCAIKRYRNDKLVFEPLGG